MSEDFSVSSSWEDEWKETTTADDDDRTYTKGNYDQYNTGDESDDNNMAGLMIFLVILVFFFGGLSVYCYLNMKKAKERAAKYETNTGYGVDSQPIMESGRD